MANNKVQVDVIIDDKGNLKKVAHDANKAGQGLDQAARASNNYNKGQKGVAGATSNSTKAFSKMSGGMGGMVGVYAEVASRVFALSAAFQFLKSASDITNLIAGQEALGAVSGVAYKTLTQGLKDATNGQLSYADAAKAAAIGTAAGLSPDQLNRLGKAAKNTSIALGRDLGDSFDRLIRGVTKAEPELLDELGIILRLETAKKNYALQIGKTAQTLTQFEQSQAVANEVLTQAETKFGDIEKIMDPSAASLNRFLVSFDSLLNSIKQFTTTALRPVFDFLSDNTIALSAALLLLGRTVLLAVLPNFEKMGEGASIAMGKANLRVAEHEAHLENLQRTIKKTQAAMLPGKEAATAKATKAYGKAVPSTTVGGGGAMDFLMGSSQTKKAAAQADKALKHAEQQLKLSLDKRTGMFKHMNAQQLADMRAAYAQREAIILREQGVQKVATMSAREGARVLRAEAALTFASMKAGMISLGATAAVAGAALMSFLGWIGILAMVGSALYAAFQYIFPVPKKIKEAQDAAEGYISSAKTLNSELKKMAQVTNEVNMQLDDLTAQRGGMAQQSNLSARLTEYRATAVALGINGKETKKLRAGLIETVITLGTSVSPEFNKFAILLHKNKVLTKDQKIELNNLTNKYTEFGVAVKAMPGLLDEVNKSLVAITGLPKDINPLASLTENVQKATATSKTALEGLKHTLQGATQELYETEGKLKLLQEMPKTIKVSESVGVRGKRFNKTSEVANPDYDEAKEKALTEEKNKQFEEAGAALKLYLKAVAQREMLLDLEDRLTKKSEQINSNYSEAVRLREELVTTKTRGLTIDDRIKDLALEDNELQAKMAEALSAQIIATEALAASQKSSDDKTKKNAELGKEAADSKVRTIQKEIDLQTILTKESETNLGIEKELLALKKDQNALDIHAVKLAREKALNDSGTASFGFGQAAAGRSNSLADLTNKQEQARLALAEVENKLGQDGLKEEEKKARTQAVALAKEALETATQQLAIEQNIGKTILNNVRKESEVLKFKSNNFAWSKKQQKVQELIIEAMNKGIPITKEFIAQTKEVVAENQKLTDQYEMQATIRGSLTSGMASSISALIKGEEASFKDAMLVLAQNVLSSIADKLAEQLTENLLDGFFDSPSTKMSTAITTSSQTGATAMTAAITTSSQTGATAMTAGIIAGATQAAGILGAAIAAAESLPEISKVITENIPDPTKPDAGIINPPGSKGIAEVLPTALDNFKESMVSLFDKDTPFLEGLKGVFISGGDLFSSMFSGLGSMLGGLFGGGGGTGFLSSAFKIGASLFGYGAKTGGIMSPGGKVKGYATGGIARGSGSGYPALLHGTEAVVPLPNGRSIPVDMPQNAGQQQNNVVVNVSADGRTNTSGSSGPDMDKLGVAIAKAVQQELQSQKRSGGILSPYGAA